jgi:HlyD family secretion protein
MLCIYHDVGRGELMSKGLVKIIAGCLIVAILGVGGYFGYKNYANKSVVANSRFVTSKVKKGNIDVTVQATGTIQSVSQVNIYSPDAGTIQNLPFNEGDTVKKGDVVCKVVDESNQANEDLATAQNTLAQKQQQLSVLEQSLDDLYIKAPADGTIKAVFAAPGDEVTSLEPAYGGLATLVVDGTLEVNIPFPSSGKIAQVYVSAGQKVKKGDNLFKMDDTDIQNNIAADELQIQQASNDLNFKEASLKNGEVTSPIDGVVSNLNFKQGDSVDASILIATIIDPNNMQIILPVDELDITKVKVGQKATISVDAITGKTYQGTVQKIATSGQTTNNVTTFNVTISIANPQGIKQGMNANVTIAVQSKENTLTIPIEALIQRNGKQFVMVPASSKINGSTSGMSSKSNGANDNTQGFANSNKKTGAQRGSSSNGSNASSGNKSSSARSSYNGAGVKLVPVTTGLENENDVEILSGLNEGDTVLISLPKTSSSSNNKGGMGGAGGFGKPGN